MQKSSRGLHYRVDELPAPAGYTRGLPVLFHHGIGTNHQIWDGWLPALAPRHQLIRFDTRDISRCQRTQPRQLRCDHVH